MALRIKEICRQKGMTMGEIAEKIGISPVNLSASLNGNPTLNRLQEVADILGVEISDLFVKESHAQIRGYLEYAGEIVRVESLEAVKQFIKNIEAQEQKNDSSNPLPDGR